MIDGILEMVVYVDDMEVVYGFYIKIFGLMCMVVGECFYVYDVGLVQILFVFYCGYIGDDVEMFGGVVLGYDIIGYSYFVFWILFV